MYEHDSRYIEVWDSNEHEYIRVFCPNHGQYFHYTIQNEKMLKKCDFCGEMMF